MENHIKNLKIQNFKSLKDIEMDCSRINLIVGKPNVGKSNILEALSLFCAPFSESEKFLSEFIRFNLFHDFFPFGNRKEKIWLEADSNHLQVSFEPETDSYFLKLGQLKKLSQISSLHNKKEIDKDHYKNLLSYKIEPNGTSNQMIVPKPDFLNSFIKKYKFVKQSFEKEWNRTFLKPPFGENLTHVLVGEPELSQEFGKLMKEYDLELVIDEYSNKVSTQRRRNFSVYPIQYYLIADTLQRYIFHRTAIESNKNSILLFEEPESHSFPPYIHQLANEIIYDEGGNQFFITTHSPHLFNTIVENAPIEEQAVFIATYKDYQTKLKKLNEEEFGEILNYGIDIFFNQKYFLDDE